MIIPKVRALTKQIAKASDRSDRLHNQCDRQYSVERE